MIAFVEDPDGYKIEFIENKSCKIWSRQLIKSAVDFLLFYNQGCLRYLFKGYNMSNSQEIPYHHQLKNRFRGYFPVIIDVETAGFDAKKDALLELAAITLKMDENGNLQPDQKCHFHIEPFEGANINPESLKFNGIDIHNPLRGAVSELDAITGIVPNGASWTKRCRMSAFYHRGT